jgi:hypothetical protein
MQIRKVLAEANGFRALREHVERAKAMLAAKRLTAFVVVVFQARRLFLL